jgi:hypothetical protein
MQATPKPDLVVGAQGKPAVRVFVDGDKSTTLQIPQSHDDMMALLAQRRMLNQQLEETTDHRNDVSKQLNAALESAKPAFQAQLNVLNDRIVQIESSLNVVSQEIAGAAPGLASMAEESTPPAADDPFGSFADGVAVGGVSGVVGITMLFLITRWIWRKVAGRNETPRRPALPADDSERLKRLENGIDAMAVEVERISEGQRFVTKLLAESKGYESAPR